MTKFIGRLADIGIAKESSRGTAESAADFWIPKTSLTYDDTIEQVVDESSIGVVEDSANAVVVSKSGAGSIEGNVGDKSLGLLLLSALGSVSTSGPTDTSVYTHTFSVGQSAQHQSLTLFLDDPNQDYTYANAMVDKFELDMQVGKFTSFKIDFQSKVGATASLSPSYSTENPFLPQHGSFGYASDLSGLASATAMAIRSLKLTVDKNVDKDMKVGSDEPVDLLNKQVAVSGTIEFVFDANTFKTEMLADTPKALRIRMTNSDVIIGATTNPRLTIDLAKVKFSKFERKYGNNDIVTASVDFKAFYSVADSKLITAELINTQTAY